MIRVLIDRRLREGADQAYNQAQRELRGGALHCRGYITGETWRDLDDPRHYVVVSTWQSRGEWDEWAAAPERRRVLEKMRPLLDAERITLFEAA